MNRSCAVFAIVALVATGNLRAATYVVPPDSILVAKSDAIAVARVQHSRVEESPERGIETVTVFALDEAMKGAMETRFEVRVPGGIIGGEGKATRMKVMAGAPRFLDGQQVLLFMTREGNPDYRVTDLALGSFSVAVDEIGTRVLVRGSDVTGWTLDGSVHREPRRHADRFIAYVRDLTNDRPASVNYLVDARPLASDLPISIGRLAKSTDACAGCSASQYTIANPETDRGLRWKTFPVPWNRGNVLPIGNDPITLAFSQWARNSSVNFVLATQNPDLDGILEAPDGVNNIVFEKSLSALGIGPFSCASGGVLGVGGVNEALGDSTNTVGSEVFFRTTEGDVSMNVGVNACIGTTMSVGNYSSAITHEVGHALGFRHSDRSRDNNRGCPDATLVNYDCEATAIMTATISNGLGGVLQPWDLRAVAALYPGAAAPPPPAPAVAGDANGDGIVNEADRTLIKSAFRSNRGPVIPATQTSDCNADGIISGRDVVCVTDIITPTPGTQTSTLDVDRNGSSQGFTDGLLLLRRFFSFSGSTLTNGVIGSGSNRSSAAAIQSYIAAMDPIFDVDGDNLVQPLTDGLLILRYLLGFRGPTLINGAVAPGASRPTAASIEAYIASL